MDLEGILKTGKSMEMVSLIFIPEVRTYKLIPPTLTHPKFKKSYNFSSNFSLDRDRSNHFAN